MNAWLPQASYQVPLHVHFKTFFQKMKFQLLIVFSVIPSFALAVPVPHNILSGIGLIGSNGNANSDDSNSQNVIANGKQFASGIGVSNSPSLVVGDTINNFQTAPTH
ncbi:hypothetical protein BKA57DRAFT_454353 [Linnemannia elongata]|nr:hypothetical protein BKA57DRAFT_454353 [Linnemannia elongata]